MFETPHTAGGGAAEEDERYLPGTFLLLTFLLLLQIQGKTKTGLPPIQIQPPSMGSVLDMLNIINGILFVQISQADIENFKKEYETRQKDIIPGQKQIEK